MIENTKCVVMTDGNFKPISADTTEMQVAMTDKDQIRESLYLAVAEACFNIAYNDQGFRDDAKSTNHLENHVADHQLSMEQWGYAWFHDPHLWIFENGEAIPIEIEKWALPDDFDWEATDAENEAVLAEMAKYEQKVEV